MDNSEVGRNEEIQLKENTMGDKSFESAVVIYI